MEDYISLKGDLNGFLNPSLTLEGWLEASKLKGKGRVSVLEKRMEWENTFQELKNTILWLQHCRDRAEKISKIHCIKALVSFLRTQDFCLRATERFWERVTQSDTQFRKLQLINQQLKAPIGAGQYNRFKSNTPTSLDSQWAFKDFRNVRRLRHSKCIYPLRERGVVTMWKGILGAQRWGKFQVGHMHPKLLNFYCVYFLIPFF